MNGPDGADQVGAATGSQITAGAAGSSADAWVSQASASTATHPRDTMPPTASIAQLGDFGEGARHRHGVDGHVELAADL